MAPSNDQYACTFGTPPSTSIAGVNVSPAQPKLPPLATAVLSVTLGTIDGLAQTAQARVSVALPQGYPAVTQALTFQPSGSPAGSLAADTWVSIRCGLPTTFALTVTGMNTDPPSQTTSTAVTPNCTPRVPTLTLVSSAANSATFTYRLTDGGPVESATWSAVGSAGSQQTGTAGAPGGGSGADFTVANLAPGTRTQVRMVVVSAGGQSRQSNIVDVWSAPPTFSYPAITGKVGVPIRPVSPSPAVDPKSVSQLRPAVPLAPGLRMDPATGVISGTPTAASTGTVSLDFAYAGSANPRQAERSLDAISYAIAGTGLEPTFGTLTLSAEVGVPITPLSLASAVSNAPAGATYAAPALCALGLTVDPATGLISGTPTRPFASTGAQPAYSLVNAVPGDGCRITGKAVMGLGATGRPSTYGRIVTVIKPLTAPRIWYAPGMAVSKQVHGTVGSSLTVPGPTSAGTGSVVYAIGSGTLPAGLGLDTSTGAIGGVPTTSGRGVTVTLVATDAGGRSSTPVTILFDISDQPATAMLAYPTPVLARVGQAVSVSPSGTVTGQSFALDQASLAAGMAIDAVTGRVSWTPGPGQVGTRVVTVTQTSPGLAPTSVTFTVRVDVALTVAPVRGVSTTSSTASSGGVSATASTGGGGASSGASGSGIGQAPCLSPSGRLYDDMVGSVGSTMTYAPNTSGMGRPNSFRVAAGSLPRGVILDSTDGIVSGTPLQSNGGFGPVTIEAIFPGGAVLSSSFNVAVDDPHHSANYPNRVIGTVGSPTAVIPESFDTHGRTRYTLVCGELPAGMSLDPATGIISGTPTVPVDYPTPLRIRQRDAYGSVDASLIMVVNASPTPWVRYPEHPISTYRQAVIITPTLSELPEQTTFQLVGKLPKGLSFDRRTGVIRGNPIGLAQNRPLTITAIGPDGTSIATTTTSITVRKPTVPLSVTARHASARIGAKRVVVVTKSRHPKWMTAVTRVKCTGCTSRVDTRTGRVTITPGRRTTQVTVTIVAQPRQASSMYRPHVWTRTWIVRKR